MKYNVAECVYLVKNKMNLISNFEKLSSVNHVPLKGQIRQGFVATAIDRFNPIYLLFIELY